MQANDDSASPPSTPSTGRASTYATRTTSTSATTMTSTKDLAVPKSSQMIHSGQFPQWGGGGEAWCSPTSTSMVMRYFNAGPKPADYDWSPTQSRTSTTPPATRSTTRYDGTGNWPFNTAYAAGYSLDRFVTRLDTLREAEAFIKAGIPLVASVAFGKGELDRRPDLVDAGPPAGDPGLHRRAAGSSPTTRRRPRTRRCGGSTRASSSRRRGSGAAAASSYVIRPDERAPPARTPPRW